MLRNEGDDNDEEIMMTMLMRWEMIAYDDIDEASNSTPLLQCKVQSGRALNHEYLLVYYGSVLISTVCHAIVDLQVKTQTRNLVKQKLQRK